MSSWNSVLENCRLTLLEIQMLNRAFVSDSYGVDLYPVEVFQDIFELDYVIRF